MLIIGAIASAIGIAVALSINWFPLAADAQAHQIDTLYDVLLIFSVPIFVLVEVVVLFSVWKFRMRPGEELRDGPPIHGNTTLEVIWTAVPAILLVGLCSYAYVVLTQIERRPAHEMVVNVTGQQFAWSFQYPGAGPGGKSITSDQLYLAKGLPVEFHVRSKDVIHDFWYPSSGSRSTPCRESPPSTGSTPRAPATTVWSARSCADSGTPRCARRRTCCPGRASRRG